MRIVHVIDYFHPGLGYQETFLAREHIRLGHDVFVITSDRYSPLIYPMNKSLLGQRILKPGFTIEEGIPVWRLKTACEMPRGIFVRGFEDKLREIKPELVIVHGIANYFAIKIARMKKNAGFKLIFDDHMTMDNSTSIYRVFYPVFRLLFARSIRNAADAIVAVLPETRTFMSRVYGFPPGRITVIPLGADAELFRFDAEARRRTRQHLGIGYNDIVFIYSGKITPLKGLPVLIAAASQLMKKYDNVKVVILGSGQPALISDVKKLINEQSPVGRFIWHDSVPNRELAAFYSAADVAVWPRGASISQREAMACGLPIIIGKDSLVTELIAYHNGLAYKDGDYSDLAKQMETLLDSEVRKNMGQNGRRLIEEKFSWRSIATRFLELVR